MYRQLSVSFLIGIALTQFGCARFMGAMRSMRGNSPSTRSAITTTSIPLSSVTGCDYFVRGGVLICVRGRSSGSGSVEVHTPEPLHLTTPLVTSNDFIYKIAPNRDLVAIKINNTNPNPVCNPGGGTKKCVEVHTLAYNSFNGANRYQTFTMHAATPIPVDALSQYQFELFDHDLVAIKVNNTSTNSVCGGGPCVEVHELPLSNNYQQFTIDVSTPIPTSALAQFVFDISFPDGSLVAIKTNSTDSNMVEMHALAYPGFTQWNQHAATSVPVADAQNFTFAMDGSQLDGLKIASTPSGYLEHWSAIGQMPVITPAGPPATPPAPPTVDPVPSDPPAADQLSVIEQCQRNNFGEYAVYDDCIRRAWQNTNCAQNYGLQYPYAFCNCTVEWAHSEYKKCLANTNYKDVGPSGEQQYCEPYGSIFPVRWMGEFGVYTQQVDWYDQGYDCNQPGFFCRPDSYYGWDRYKYIASCQLHVHLDDNLKTIGWYTTWGQNNTEPYYFHILNEPYNGSYENIVRGWAPH